MGRVEDVRLDENTNFFVQVVDDGDVEWLDSLKEEGTSEKKGVVFQNR